MYVKKMKIIGFNLSNLWHCKITFAIFLYVLIGGASTRNDTICMRLMSCLLDRRRAVYPSVLPQRTKLSGRQCIILQVLENQNYQNTPPR